jgi:hypothetical protein
LLLYLTKGAIKVAHFQLTKEAFTKLDATTANCFTQWDVIGMFLEGHKRLAEPTAPVSSRVISFYTLCDARIGLFFFSVREFECDSTVNIL